MADSTTSNLKSSPNEEIANQTNDEPDSEKINKIQEELDQWKNTTVKIAIIGQSGVGKSSFINKFRGLTPKDKHKKDSQGNYLYAAVSFVSCLFCLHYYVSCLFTIKNIYYTQ